MEGICKLCLVASSPMRSLLKEISPQQCLSLETQMRQVSSWMASVPQVLATSSLEHLLRVGNIVRNLVLYLHQQQMLSKPWRNITL